MLRVWAASTDYTRDVLIGPELVAGAATTLRALRNCARFMLGTLHDFDPAAHAVPAAAMPELDRYALHLVGPPPESLAFVVTTGPTPRHINL